MVSNDIWFSHNGECDSFAIMSLVLRDLVEIRQHSVGAGCRPLLGRTVCKIK